MHVKRVLGTSQLLFLDGGTKLRKKNSKEIQNLSCIYLNEDPRIQG